MVLTDKKFNEEQLFLETFFFKMHIEPDIHKNVICRGLKTLLKKVLGGGVGVLICCEEHHSRTFSALLPAHVAMFFPVLPRA